MTTIIKTVNRGKEHADAIVKKLKEEMLQYDFEHKQTESKFSIIMIGDKIPLSDAEKAKNIADSVTLLETTQKKESNH